MCCGRAGREREKGGGEGDKREIETDLYRGNPRRRHCWSRIRQPVGSGPWLADLGFFGFWCCKIIREGRVLGVVRVVEGSSDV